MVQLNYAGKVQKDEDGNFKIVANWDDNIKAEGETLQEAKQKFSDEVANYGVEPSQVGFKMSF